ncbi:hypothetical protein UCDDA912_g01530 [Diaporthe ampelina]|uniref:Uncharacterized protein n=1 Tax=Diaporthe ampelina TaxID=1214573 RepID=A0A0G2FX31_9PEZI|nr:hypothetical protein UCDDA912_g01530 [Diaporthe ampelina]
MESSPDSSDPPDHPSSSVGSTINSGSDGFGSPSRSRRGRSESRESSPGPLIIERSIDVKDLNQGNSASNNGDGEDMTDEEFFAQFGEEIPEWAKLPPDAEPQAQDNGFQDLREEDLEAQIDSELGPGDGDASMDISQEDLEAQLDIELSGGDDDLMELCEEDLEAQLNAEIEADTLQEDAAEAARRKANLEEALRIAAEQAALVVSYDQRDNPSPPGGAANGPLGNINNAITVMSELGPNVNTLAVKRHSKMKSMNRPKKRARKTAPKPKHSGPLEARVGRSQPPPMRKTDELPQLYHHNTRVDLNRCYRSLGLDVGRGKAVYDNLREYLRIPGNSVNLSAKDVDTGNTKRIIADIAHKLLVDQRWGRTYFDRPSLASGCKFITFQGNSTEVFLEFTSLVYKAMKLEEKRKKGRAKQQEEKAAREVVQHPTSEAFATTTYFSPQAVAQALPSQAPTDATGNSSPVATKQQPQSQAFTNAAVNSSPVVSQPAPPQAPNNGAQNYPRVPTQQSQPQAFTNTANNSPGATVQQPRPQPPSNAQGNLPRVATQQPRSRASTHAAVDSYPVVSQQQQPANARNNGSHLGMEQAQSQPPANTQSNLPRVATQQQRRPQEPTRATNHPVQGVTQQPSAQASTNGASNPPRPVTQRQPPAQATVGGVVIAPRSVAPRPPSQPAAGAAHSSPHSAATQQQQRPRLTS